MISRFLPWLLCSIFIGLITQAHAATFRVGLLHGDAEIFDYELSVIRLALANAPGQHKLEVVPIQGTPQNRMFALLEREPPPINLFFSGYSPERESRLRQVNFPLTRGLLGFRLLVAKSERLSMLSDLKGVDDLKSLRIGSGTGWPENQIFVQNGLVLETSEYDNLWRMLDYERFDVFHRGMQEVFTELRKPGREGLSIVPGIALAMRYDYFLYVARHRDDLHDILLEGLETAHRNGAFLEHFHSHPQIRIALAESQLSQRHTIWLETPKGSLETIPSEYWHAPSDQLSSAP